MEYKCVHICNSYFTCWGLIMQADVSVLSVCATNNRCTQNGKVKQKKRCAMIPIIIVSS